MSIDIAYSLEINEYLDPDRAYDLYWAGLIKNKKDFLCPGTDCEAQVTCANLDEDVQDMKVVPHFRVYGSHAESCEIFNQIPLNLRYESSISSKEERRPVNESITDVFLLERPSSYYDEKLINENTTKTGLKQSKTIKHAIDSILRESGSVGNIYSVRSVVSRYIRYKKDRSLDNRKVNIKGRDVYYKSIFKCIWEQDLESLPDYPVIYYGWAFINRIENINAYQIKFKKNFRKSGVELKTTILINDRLIDGYKVKKLVTTRLEKIVKKEKPTAFVFIYGRPEEKESKKGVKFANFSISNLDMIDINYDCPLPKEYNK